jgi:hypothetical protein
MNLYKLRYGEHKGIFEYVKFLNSNSLKEINKNIDGFPLLNNNDMELLRGCGGTVIYKTLYSHDDCVIDYIIDIDFEENITHFDDWKSKIGKFISIIKRDIKIKELGI